jgi:hypothetical protein
MKRQVITEFIDSNKGESYNYTDNLDSLFYDDALVDSSLETFLNRPVKIASYVWAQGSLINQTFQPWHLFFNNATIKKKVDNYAFINCNLKIKIVVNASPFYYGLALTSYKPLTTYASGELMGISASGTILPKSQRPHVWLYPQNNQGGEMVLPFLYPLNWLDLTSATALQNMGVVSIDSVGVLSNANAVVGTDVDIQIYCWAENVRISGPTYEVAVQSGTDEYNTDGLISKPASAIASVADTLSDFPVIGKYMKATSVVGKGVAGIASYLGFTNVPNIKDMDGFKSVPFPALASSEISTPVDKLTFDPKNELTIDNTVCGADSKDELIIKNFCSKESYISDFAWTAARVSGDRILTMEVNPNLFQREFHPVNGVFLNFTPMGYVNRMFRYWRGDIVYRFRFICTQYHRGRVRISWDPISVSGGDEEVYNYSKIVDINETTDVEFSVQYNQAAMWQDTSDNTLTPYWGDHTHVLPSESESSNGFLKVDVVNAQTSPSASADIFVVVSARCGANFELACPKQLNDDHGFYDNVPQGGMEDLPMEDSPPQCLTKRKIKKMIREIDDHCNDSINKIVDTLYIENDPVDCLENQMRKNVKRLRRYDLLPQSGDIDYQSTTLKIQDKSATHNALYLAHMGESIQSLRQVLRRTTYSRSTTHENLTPTAVMNLLGGRMSRYPLYNGYDPNGIHDCIVAAVPGKYNFVKNIPFNWLGACFVGSRGAVHWHINSSNPTNITKLLVDRVQETLVVADYEGIESSYLAAVNRSAKSRSNSVNNTNSFEGISLTDQKTQASLGVSLPYYSKLRMRDNSAQYRTLGSLDTFGPKTTKDSFKVLNEVSPAAGANPLWINTHFYFSIGTDFNFVFFLNVPTVLASTVPASN